VEDIAGVLEHVRCVFPAINVLLELGRPGISFGQPAVMTFRLMDLLHHTRSQDVGQVMTMMERQQAAQAREAAGSRTAKMNKLI
jgi:hypothetical protein